MKRLAFAFALGVLFGLVLSLWFRIAQMERAFPESHITQTTPGLARNNNP